MKNAIILLLLSCMVGLGALVAYEASVATSQHLPMSTVELRHAKQKARVLEVEVAEDAPSRERGLMHRRQVTGGMLFAFDAPERLAFWMKDTLVPLDIYFFDARGRFVSSARMEPCIEDPCATYLSSLPAQYALEVPRGYAETRGVGTGWELRLRP